MFTTAVDRCPEEMGPRVDTRCVDVVVLGEVAHSDRSTLRGWLTGGREGVTRKTTNKKQRVSLFMISSKLGRHLWMEMHSHKKGA